VNPLGRLPPLLATIFLLAAGPQPRQEQAPDVAPQVRALVEQLKEASPARRKKAEEDLVLIGTRALPILVEAVADNEGDLKSRLESVIAKIEHNRKLFLARGKTLLLRLNAKDRPVKELLAEFKKSTGISFEIKGSAINATTTIEGEAVSLWDAIDRICKTHGQLSWEVTNDGISIRGEPYVPPMMVTASGYALIMRGYVRRSEDAPGGRRDYLDSDAWILGPPGVVSIARYLTYDRLVDDRETNLLKGSGSPASRTSVGGYKILPDPDEAHPFHQSVADLVEPTPAQGAVRVTMCRGTAVVRAVVDLKKTLEIRGPALKKGGKAAAAGLTVKIAELEVTGARVKMEIDIADTRVGGKKDRNLFYPESGGKVVLRDSTGRDLKAYVDPTTGASTFSGPGGPPANETTRFKVEALLKSDSPLATIEVWEPSEIEEIKIPFDLKDVPIRKAK